MVTIITNFVIMSHGDRLRLHEIEFAPFLPRMSIGQNCIHLLAGHDAETTKTPETARILAAADLFGVLDLQAGTNVHCILDATRTKIKLLFQEKSNPEAEAAQSRVNKVGMDA